MNAIAPIGHNGPPASPFEAIKTHLEDLLTEARNWADGAAIETQAQCDEVDRLVDELRAGMNVAEEKRVEEKRPLDEQIAEIQDRYNVYVAPLKNKKPGKVPLAIKALLATQTPWLQRIADEKAAEAKRLQDIADEKARLAREALQAAEPTNLAAIEEAEAMFTEAAQTQRVAGRMAKGATSGTGLRTYYEAALTDGVLAARYYWAERRPECEAFFLSLAKADVAAGKRQIPGFTITEERRAI